MRITDGNKMVEVKMMTSDGTNYSPDFSDDFFQAGQLLKDEETDCYIVNDVDYCVEQANDWLLAQGDYYEDDNCDVANRVVIVAEI